MVSNKGLKPPKARKKTKKTKIHGLTINDDYSWLRDNNWQEVLREPSLLKPSIKKYLDEENNWTKQKLTTAVSGTPTEKTRKPHRRED